ncbi:MAG: hypothetical protein GY845_30240 [Planctomycetes bacterium]|nr:hypothetical protein [Planctomycetota bacterium]
MYRSNRETGKGVTLHMLNKSVSRKGPVSFRLKDAYEFLNKRELDWAASWIEKLRKPDDFSENNFRNVKQGKCIEIIWQKDLWGTFVNSIWPEGITGVTKAGIRGHGTGGRYKHWSNELDEHLRRNCGEPLWQLSDPEWFNIIETL